ncbi:MAG: hypothetical protein ACTTKL_03325 [Treponema sp.]
MIKKIGFLLGTAMIFVSCKTIYRLESLTPDVIDELQEAGERGKVTVRTSLAEKINAANFPDDTDDRLYIQRLQYYISSTIIFEWDNSNRQEGRFVISETGKLKKVNEMKQKQLVIPGDSHGILVSPPEKQDDRYVLSLNFDNIILEFKEGDNGLFYLTTPSVRYGGYTYLRDTDSVCKLQYRRREENALYTVSRSAWGKRVQN